MHLDSDVKILVPTLRHDAYHDTHGLTRRWTLSVINWRLAIVGRTTLTTLATVNVPCHSFRRSSRKEYPYF